MDTHDDKFIEATFKLAQNALGNGEVPVGCVIVINDKVVASGHNEVNKFRNATRHAELVALDKLISEMNGDINCLKDAHVYTNVEPCIMCADALRQVGVRSVRYGCSNERFGGMGSVRNVYLDAGLEPNDYDIRGGLQKDRAIELLKQFYNGQNPNK